MKFYVENQNGEKLYEGSQEDCTKEIDRLINSGDGYYFLFDETDPNEAWQEGGLVEVKEKMEDYAYWEENYPSWKSRAFDLGAGKLTSAQQGLHLTDGTLAYLQALSSPETNPAPKVLSYPPIRK